MPAVVVSSKLSSESVMIGQMIRLLLNANGIATIDRTTLGATPVVRKALLAGEIDIYVEYTGNAGFFFNRSSDPAWKDLRRGYELGARLDYGANRIVWLTPGQCQQLLGAGGARRRAAANGLHNMSDFARWVAGAGAGRAGSVRPNSPMPVRSPRSSDTMPFKLRPSSSSCWPVAKPPPQSGPPPRAPTG